ncbi:MAG: NADH-quinone oxidoreductase subunit F [Peptococcaceae bacterium]|nr:NADH-quinone oxidoreductase subunit F [Peptococcaceae bacterium]
MNPLIYNIGHQNTEYRTPRPRVLLKRVGCYQDPASVEEYLGLGGFAGLHRVTEMEKTQALDEIDIAMLRGRGGAAYPAGRKWKHLFGMKAEPKYIVCNGDEGEPGTFKDRLLLEEDPFSVLEGMLIAAYIFGAESAYIFIRGEYRRAQELFRRAVKSAEEAGYAGETILGIPGFSCRVYVVSGAGAYVCGENSALLNTIEGRTGRPRVKPPHLAEFGLYLKPTLVNNVESFACVPAILTMGGRAFLELGTEDGGGTKLVCLSGHAKNRGVFEAPLGTPMREVLYGSHYGGGTATGRPIQFCHFGGQSGPIGFPEQLDGLFSYQDLWDEGLAMGTGAVVVMDDSVDLVEYVRQVVAFFVHESCGKCTPCRVGTMRMLECLDGGSVERLEEIIEHVTNLSACGLGQTAGCAVGCALKYRREQFERRALNGVSGIDFHRS